MTSRTQRHNPTGICRDCRRLVTLTEPGRVAQHQAPTGTRRGNCPGSDRPPRKEKRRPRRVET
jgi:hypothetical protein